MELQLFKIKKQASCWQWRDKLKFFENSGCVTVNNTAADKTIQKDKLKTANAKILHFL